ncbi:MAG: hypothetical protein ACFE8A_11490 [Candidatus Hodarchaeota archaeon]
MKKKRKLWTIGQIDATGVRGPHEKELSDISKSKYPVFINLDINKLERIVTEDIGGKMDNLGFDEDWTISLEFFPEANIHISFTNYGDEFGDYLEAEFKFFFSGERVILIPGEDSATFIDLVLDFLEKRIKGEEPFEKSYDIKSELMQNVLIQRNEPFKLLKEEDRDGLAIYLGAKVWKTTNGWRIKREIFSKIFVEISWNTEHGLDISYSGENLGNFSSYHIELVGIFIINHILRYITLNNLDKDLEDICYQMFSRYYTKQMNWDHRRT